MPERSTHGPPAERIAALMTRALALAERAGGASAPNPMVGCVIADDDGRIVGEGYHARAGEPHAEIIALERVSSARRALRGTTVIVNLEPCAHYGRTRPCTDALIAAGVKAVVYAIEDPHDGRGGAARLRVAGVEVRSGVGEAPARRLNESWLHWAATRSPFFHLKVGQTLSAHMTRGEEGGRWITGTAARACVHRLRRRQAAVMVGIETVLVDDPVLTVRDWPPRLAGFMDPAPEVVWPHVQPRRIVLDSHLRLPLGSRLVAGVATSPVLVFCRDDADRNSQAALEQVGIEVVRTASSARGLDLMAVARALGERGVTGVLVEPGPRLAASFFEAGLVDRWTAFLAPDWVGREDALRLPVPATGITLEDLEWDIVGRDAMVTGRIRHDL